MRLEAARRIGRVLRERSATLEEALAAGGEERDAALTRAMVLATVRRLGDIDAIITQLTDRPLPRKAVLARDLLRIGAAQILFLRTADHAAVAATVAAARARQETAGFAGLANAVLRRLVRERDERLAALRPGDNTPAWLWRRWRDAYGEAAAAAIADSHRREPPLDLTARGDPDALAAAVGGTVLPTGTVRLAGGGRIDALPGFADGAFWVQDAAAALPARLLGPVAGLRVADACAAPGGKTLQLARAGADVTAIDVSPERLARVQENLSRTGLSAATVAADVLAYAPDAPFDAVLVDAPCTATGTIRRHPDIPWLKSERDPKSLSDLQAALVARAAAWLKPGGRLVVCTCSLEPEEGDGLARRIAAEVPALAADPVGPHEVAGAAPFLTADGALRTLPGGPMLPEAQGGRFDLDGFFAARFTRRP